MNHEQRYDERPGTGVPGLQRGTRVRWDQRARLWGDGAFVLGGAPWGVVKLGERARSFARRLRRAGGRGLTIDDDVDRATADRLVARGIAHPLVDAGAPSRHPADVAIVVPAFERTELLESCLAALTAAGGEVHPTPAEVVVVDDGSADPAPMRRVAERYGVRLIRHEQNQGPAAARNTGVDHTEAPLIVFLDSDCRVPPGWRDGLLPHFADPRVGAVAPRLLARHDDDTCRTRYEDVRSSLDMGDRPELVVPGAPLGYVPSAAVVMRRDALRGRAFEPAMRVGEDVDLVWRLVEAGWLVRYEPTVEVRHETRTVLREWARRKFDYGTSAALLDQRHPGRLAPARVTATHVATLGLVIAGHPVAAAAVAGTAVFGLAARFHSAGAQGPRVAAGMGAAVVGKGVLADAVGIGHLLRREWWPIGWTALTTAGRSRAACAASVAMVAPLVADYVRTRPRIDPVRYVLLRLAEDAAYGSGVISGAIGQCRFGPLRPAVTVPRAGKSRSR